MRRALTSAEQTLLATHPQKSKMYMIVDKPDTVFSARVNNASIANGARAIAYDTASGTASNVKAGMTLLVGSTAGARDLGKVRIKSITGTTSGTITVAENSDVAWADNAYLTVLNVTELWSVFPRMTYSGGTMDWFKDYDTNYDTNSYRKQNVWLPPVAIMGPPGVAFLDSGSATLKFVGEDSYTICPNGIKINYSSQGDVGVSATCAWAFPSGTPSSSTSLGTEATPISVTWTAAGRYLVSLQVKNDKPSGYEKTHTGYRPVYILNRPGTAGTNEPYDQVSIDAVSGDFAGGGWAATIRVFGDADISEFPDNAMIVLFSEDWYGITKQSIGGYPYRENVKLVAWIMEETIEVEFDADGERYVEFKVQTIDGLLKEKEGYPNTIEDRPSMSSGNTEANEWWQMFKLQVNRAAQYMLHWHSTLMQMTDVLIMSDNSRVAAQDFPDGSLYRQIDDYAGGTVMGRLLSDKQSLLYLEKNIQVEPASWRSSRPTVLGIDKNIHLREGLQFNRRHIGKVRFIELSGVKWDGYNATPILSTAPGATPRQDGVDDQIKGLVVETQAEADEIVGYALADRNNPWPDVPLKMQGNHSYLDIAPQGWLTMSLDANDTKRGVVWVDKKLVPRRVTMKYDHKAAAIMVDTVVDAEAGGTSGVTGDYTPVEPLRGSVAWSPDLVPGWNGIAYCGTDNGLYRMMTRSVSWELVTNNSDAPFGNADELYIAGMDFDVSQLADAVLNVVIATNQGIFISDLIPANGDITWTKWDISDPPNDWGDAEPLTADDLTYTHIKADITDPTGQTFYFVASGLCGSDFRCWIGTTDDAGSTFSWWRCFGAFGVFEVTSMDVDKEDGSRLVVTGQTISGIAVGFVVFNTSTGAVITSVFGDGTYGVQFSSPIYAVCPYIPTGSTIDGDYIILHGSSLAKFLVSPPTDISGILYYDGSDLQQLCPAHSYGAEAIYFVDAMPGDETDLVALRYFFSGEEGASAVCKLMVNTDAEKWYSMTDWDVNGYETPIASSYNLAHRHKRLRNLLLMAGYDAVYGRSLSVYLTVNGGVSWHELNDGLADNFSPTCFLLDWGTSL